MKTTWCICGRCPSVRQSRGLAAFCQMAAPVMLAAESVSRLELEKMFYGQAIRSVSVRGGVGHGPAVAMFVVSTPSGSRRFLAKEVAS